MDEARKSGLEARICMKMMWQVKEKYIIMMIINVENRHFIWNQKMEEIA